MLPRVRRLTRRGEIAAVARARRAGSPLLVVHARPVDGEHSPRFAVAVGRGVGGSVTRHSVARKIRHLISADMAHWDELGMDALIRALPASANASSSQLAADLRKCRQKLERSGV